MLRTLLTRRWVVLTLVLAALIPTFYRLGLWQYHRYEQTNRLNAMIEHNESARPVPVTSLSKPGGTVPFSQTYRKVSATGHYDAAHEFVVRQRTNASGDVGFQVITPLIMADGEAVLVNRGWVAPASQSGTAYPRTPGVSRGTVTLTGRLRPDETYATTGIHKRPSLPARQSVIIDTREHTRDISEPLVAGYIELTATAPAPPAADQAELTPGPQEDTNSMAVVGQGVHLPYAIQWWIFAAAVPVGWWILLRRDTEIDEDARAAKSAGEGARGDGPAPADADEAGTGPRAVPASRAAAGDGDSGATAGADEARPDAPAKAPAGSGVSPAADLYALIGNDRRRRRQD
ncbi:SURF1 family cytochrome oxidase biogenesis protein [Streptomyces fuscigenes]|uniref:SURF1 family cytochrome oxidase biogenesis protein n=1 Tax=Streptomyces fuscigenes TaxID=1528880 RepID=UPI001F43E0E0|nr:SURF1 family cytochrome oxidase biogenesis protein [Streptomyces fuscigenes]MCF3962903.1 SURF1 family protein [Streptomyces fuscigenes]